MNLDPRNLTDRETLDAMITRLGGDALSDHDQTRRARRRAFEGALLDEQRLAFVVYSDAVIDQEGAREDAVMRAGLLLGVGVGVALNAYPDHDVSRVSAVAADVVSGVVAADVGSAVAQDIARQVLRALARLTDEAAGV